MLEVNKGEKRTATGEKSGGPPLLCPVNKTELRGIQLSLTTHKIGMNARNASLRKMRSVNLEMCLN
jgi:hypothetical protein